MGPPTLKSTEQLAESFLCLSLISHFTARPMIAANPKVVRRRLSNLINDKAMERTASSMSRALNRQCGGAGECDGDGDAEIGVCVCATTACNGSAEICRQRGDVMSYLVLTECKLFDCLPQCDDIRR